tara:strand:- start:280 stop:519 length:240 start_codon:yes stop_codon:yes gene_type:complete
MALTERKEIGQRTVLSDGQIQIREDTVIERDGQFVSRTYHRYVLAPGDNIDKTPPEIQRVARAEWTSEVIRAYKAAQKD